MLVLNSFGLQNALERAPLDLGHFFGRVHTSAYTCATLVRDSLGPAGFMKYSPDSHFVQTSYAVLSLLKVRFRLHLLFFWRETHFSFSYQLVRPEFQAFLENEQKTLDLVRDVADTLDNIAANPLHTPALYSGFLRALISAKLDQQQQPSSHHSLNGDEKMISASLSDGGEQQLQQQLQQQAQLQQQHQLGAADGDAHTPNSYSHHGNALHLFGGGDGGHNGNFMLNEFQFESEMGPVADISTFPPTMAPHPSEDSLGALTMENILSSGFWDSMLVPGTFAFFFFVLFLGLVY